MSARGSQPARTCIGCGERGRQGALLRLRLDDSGEPSLSWRRGRSAYLHGNRGCIEAVAKSRRLDRSLGRRIDAGLRDRIAGAFAAGATA